MRTKEEREYLDREFARMDKPPNVTPLTETQMSNTDIATQNAQHIRQLESLVGGMQQSIANYQGATSAEVAGLKEDVLELKMAMKEQTSLIRETYSKVTNGLEERVTKLEAKAHDALEFPVSEWQLNNVAKSLREQIAQMDRTYKWIIGIVTTVNMGAIGALSVLVLL